MEDTFIERPAYYDAAPCVLVIGCGDMGMGSARVLGRRAPLVVADIDADRLDRCIATLRLEGYRASGIVCDIADEASVRALGARLPNGVRTLAHVAAIGDPAQHWRRVLAVDLFGAHHIASMIEPLMVPGGAAIWVSSTGSYRSPQGPDIHALLDSPLSPNFEHDLLRLLGAEPDFLTAYFLAKQGVNRLARRLAIEWGPRQVRSLSISPGLIDSTMGRTGGKSLPVYDGDAGERLGSRSEKALREVPLQRQGTVLEVTAVVEFLASDAASFVNGIDVPVDGGSLARSRQLAEARC